MEWNELLMPVWLDCWHDLLVDLFDFMNEVGLIADKSIKLIQENKSSKSSNQPISAHSN